MSSPSPDNDPYETLGVARDATEAQITRAWRRKTRSIGPGSPEFAAINSAAELLLDPSRRSAYDAEAKAAPGDTTEASEEARAADAPETPTSGSRGRRRVLGGWNGTIVFAGVMALIAVGLAIWQGVSYANKSDATAKSGKTPTAAASAFAGPTSAQTSAVSAAQVELPVVLSYDYRAMSANVANAERFLSVAQRQKYAATMQRIIDGGTVPGTTQKLEPVVQRQAIVVATVTSVGLISATATTAQVGAYVTQVTTQKSGSATHQNWVQVGMINQGGAWLIDGICVPSAGMTCTAANG